MSRHAAIVVVGLVMLLAIVIGAQTAGYGYRLPELWQGLWDGLARAASALLPQTAACC
jgi:hypothetical protein